MGVEVLVIAIVAGVISLISGITSVATAVHVSRTLVSTSNDKTSVDILNKVTNEEKSDGSKLHTREQEIHIEDIDTDFVSSHFSGVRTGLPNKTAEILGKGGTAAFGELIKSKSPVISKALEDSKGFDDKHDLVTIEPSDLKDDPQVGLSGSSSDSE